MVRLRSALLLVLAMLAAAIFCPAQTSKTRPEAKPTQEQKRRTAQPVISEATQERLIKREKDLFAAEQRRAVAVVDEALAEDFHDIASDGQLHTKAEIIPMLADVKIEDFSLSNFKVLSLSDQCAIVTYRAEIKASYKGQSFPPKLYLSSVWVRRHGSWQIAFHQATPSLESKTE